MATELSIWDRYERAIISRAEAQSATRDLEGRLVLTTGALHTSRGEASALRRLVADQRETISRLQVERDDYRRVVSDLEDRLRKMEDRTKKKAR